MRAALIELLSLYRKRTHEYGNRLCLGEGLGGKEDGLCPGYDQYFLNLYEIIKEKIIKIKICHRPTCTDRY